MLRNTHIAIVSLGLLLGATGCNDFLTSESKDPNNPSQATAQTLLVGIQAAQFAFQEGTVPMMVCMWVQACTATNGRFVEQAGRYVFGAGSNLGANGTDWGLIYAAGGLIDMDTVVTLATRAGDSLYLGIDLVWKAFTLGSAADMWGSIPYTQIRTSPTPALDSQLVIYDTVQVTLARAITALNAAKAGAVTLESPPDLVFGGDPDAWIATANTLKARYWLHVVEAAANGLITASPFDSAIKYASLGIGDPSGAGDFRAFHSGNGYPQSNMWFQFQDNSSFGADLESGRALVDYMKGRNDPRLGDYFCTNSDVTDTWAAATAYDAGAQVLDPNGNVQQVVVAGTSGGTEPTWATGFGDTTVDNGVSWTNEGNLPYGGDDFNKAQPNVSFFDCEPLRFSGDFRVPFVTYQENQLILAEANYALGNTGPAQTNLQNAYDAVPGLASSASGVSGTALLDSIMLEKYVVMFQNIEALSDYRRTCIAGSVRAGNFVPITPVTPNVLGLTAVPGELYYPQTERNTNSNIPPESQEVNAGLRTQSDVHACTGAGAVAYP